MCRALMPPASFRGFPESYPVPLLSSAQSEYVHQFFTVHITKFHCCQFLQILKCMRHFLVHQIPPFTYSILKGVFGNQILKFHNNIFSSGCQKVLPECYRYKDNSRFSRSWGFFSLSARFAHSRSKLTFVVFPGWQS